MDIHQLKIFEAVLATGNMTRAADQLFLSPAAVSLQIRNLSRELGVQLFVRDGKQLVPTPAAKQLGALTKDLLASLARIVRNFESDAEHDTRPLTLATGITPLIYRLGRPIQRFRLKFPNSNLSVRVCSTLETIRAIQNRDVDIGIVVLPCQEPGIRTSPLYEEKMRLCLNPSITPLKGRSAKFSELLDVPFILYSRSTSATRSIVDREFEKVSFTPRSVLELDDTEAIKKLVELGFGVSILPADAVRKRSPHLHLLDIEGPPLRRWVGIATADTEYPRGLVESFSELLQRELS